MIYNAKLVDEPDVRRSTQFTIASLLEFTAVCGLLLVGTDMQHSASTFSLIGMALALATGRGEIAMVTLAFAIMTAEGLVPGQDPAPGWWVALGAKVSLLVAWYGWRAFHRAGRIDYRDDCATWDGHGQRRPQVVYHQGNFGR